MTPAEADERIIKSRHVLSGWAQALADKALAAPPRTYRKMAADEVVILRRIADHFPARAKMIGYLVEKYERLSEHIGWSVN
jgi:hypothetical protein